MGNLLKAVASAFDLYKDKDGEDIKNQIVDIVLADKTARLTIAALVGNAGFKIKDAAKALRPANWDTMSESEKHDSMEANLSVVANKENLQSGFDLLWLGICIGIAMEGGAPDKPEEQKIVEAAMEAIDIGDGFCATCGNQGHMKALGKNGDPICARCAEKDPATAQEQINKKLKEIGGDKAPIAIHAGIVKGPMNRDQLEKLANATIENHLNPASDIKKYN